MNDGEMFGPGGESHMRLNVGTPRAILQQALEQLAQAVKACRKLSTKGTYTKVEGCVGNPPLFYNPALNTSPFAHQVLTFFGRKLLDGIAQHGTGHLQTMAFHKQAKSFHIAFACLAQHPAYGFVHQVVLMPHHFSARRKYRPVVLA